MGEPGSSWSAATVSLAASGRRDEPGLGIEALALHLLGEAHRSSDVALEPGSLDEGAAALVALQAALPRELVEGPADR